jgi:hypothetical protein
VRQPYSMRRISSPNLLSMVEAAPSSSGIGIYHEKRNAQFRINTAPHATKKDTRGRGLRRTVARRTGCIRHQARPHSRSGIRCTGASSLESTERRLIGRKRAQLHLTSAQLCLDCERKFHVEQFRGVSTTEVAEVDQSTLSSESRLAET